MILFEGKLLANEELDSVLEKLWDSCVSAIENRQDIAEKVISACGQVAEKIKKGEYETMLQPLLDKGTFTKSQMEEAIAFFGEESLRAKYRMELGVIKESLPEGKELEPLGILFHIAAGNAEGLPFLSVLEGMLAGNVNILKLPSADDGLSVLLLHEILRQDPQLSPYVCVLDVPSTNLKVMKALGNMADAVVVWGGDEAVSAVRAMADPATQIISWGHKLSFAYITPEVFSATGNVDYQKELYGLARHICETNQLLCSSCQGIFVDTEDETVVLAAGRRFLQILEEVNRDYPREAVGIRGKISLALYNEELEASNTGREILRGAGVSVMVAKNSALELSLMFKNCWIKPLPRKELVRALKGKRGHLQTVGLICQEAEREELAALLKKAGVTRITHGKNMSRTTPESTHDGEYPLRRYSRIVEMEP